MAREKSMLVIRPHVVIVTVLCLWFAHAQDTHDTELQTKTARLEDVVFSDMLKIVDNKFNTLTSRITALEAAVSSLQFYSIRHFLQLTGSSQRTDKDLEAIRKQMTEFDATVKERCSVESTLAEDVSVLKKSSAVLLGEVESSVFHINENLDKQGKTLKTLVEDTVVRSARETTAHISKQIKEMIEQLLVSKAEPVSCVTDVSAITEHIDLRFAEFKQQTHAHFSQLINAARFDVRRGKRYSSKHDDGDDINKIKNDENNEKDDERNCKCKNELRKNGNIPREDNDLHVNPDSHNRIDASDKTDGMSSESLSSSAKKYQEENDEQIMNVLYNMTGSVLQAVSYFRNTGRLLEMILSNTDSVATQQRELIRKLDTFHVNGQARDDTSEQSNVIPGADNSGGQYRYSAFRFGTHPAERSSRVLPEDLFNNLTTIIKNGSHLLEVLTDLAQLSSVSLFQSINALNEEVTRAAAIRAQMEAVLLTKAHCNELDTLTILTNTTQRTYRLIETVASNTGWLPPIYSNIQKLESLTNLTLNTIMQNQAIMLRIAQQTTSISNSVTNINQGENNPDYGNRMTRPHRHGERYQSTSLNDKETLNKESLEIIYNTSLQLNRILPTLAKFLSEPDPLITLVGGEHQDRGRLEIYHNGQWGAVCHSDLSHAEATLICRHLGFKGGISAGAGHFGPGAGVTWSFNASCLATAQCPAVTYFEDAAPCSHDQDTGVICDHMLRIVSPDGGNKGRLEIHHRGLWLPICGEGWSGYTARVACQQMGFTDGREFEIGLWHDGEHLKWLSHVACSGWEKSLEACHTEGWKDYCPGLIPAGVKCV